MKHILVTSCIFLGLFGGPNQSASAQTNRQRNRRAGRERAAKPAGKYTFKTLTYDLIQPKTTDPDRTYPLVLNLHGSGGAAVRVLEKETFQRRNLCFVLIPKTKGTWDSPATKAPDDLAPLLRDASPTLQKFINRVVARVKGDQPKDLLTVLELVDKIKGEHKIDANRIYVVGHSMGGMGAWSAVWERPELFAAAIPSAGVLPPWKWKDHDRLDRTAIWAFHGSNDKMVPVETTRALFAKLSKQGGNMKYTELTGLSHGSNRTAFQFSGDDKAKGFVTKYSSDKCDKTADVWTWLFRQRRAVASSRPAP